MTTYAVVEEDPIDCTGASPSLRLIRHLGKRVLETQAQAQKLGSPEEFPDFHMHDKHRSGVTRVDRGKWHDYLNAVFNDCALEIERRVDENPDRWLAVETREQDKGEEDLGVSQKCIFCYYASQKAQYTVWLFTASTGLMFDNDRASAIDAAVPQLVALLDCRLYDQALRSVTDEVVD